MSWPLRGIAARIALVSLVVTLAAAAVIAIGVLAVSSALFAQLMVQHGSTTAAAHAMFDQTVTAVFGGALLVAAVVSGVLAVVLARRLAQPLEAVGRAAQRLACGDYQARAPRTGPQELELLADSFNRMAASLEEGERIRRDFITNAAHELRTPLTNLQGYLEALRDGVIGPDPELFGSLHEEAERLVRLSQSLDALAQGEGAPDVPGLAELDLAQALRSSVEMARPAFGRQDIGLVIEVPELVAARASHDHLSQVLANLLQNAARYTPERGQVTVRAEARLNEVVVSVTNSGDGIPPHDLPHVFERFYRVEKSRDRSRGGAGIGLAIVKELVEAGGGRVGVDSNQGLTRFWFSLPPG